MPEAVDWITEFTNDHGEFLTEQLGKKQRIRASTFRVCHSCLIRCTRPFFSTIYKVQYTMRLKAHRVYFFLSGNNVYGICTSGISDRS